MMNSIIAEYLDFYIGFYLVVGALIGFLKIAYECKGSNVIDLDNMILKLFWFTLMWLPHYLCIMLWRFICVPVGKCLKYCGEGIFRLLGCILEGLFD